MTVVFGAVEGLVTVETTGVLTLTGRVMTFLSADPLGTPAEAVIEKPNSKADAMANLCE